MSNLYWNGGAASPNCDSLDPNVVDTQRVIGNPLIKETYADLLLPRWKGGSFASGTGSVREEFVRLVEALGKPGPNSAALGKANPDYAPLDDILGRLRKGSFDMGVLEQQFILRGKANLSTISLRWTDEGEPQAVSYKLTYEIGGATQTIANIPLSTSSYTLTGLQPYKMYTVTLHAVDNLGNVLVKTDPLILMTTDQIEFLPILIQN